MEFVTQATNSRCTLALLAPPNADIPEHFENVESDPSSHQELLAGMQRLRGQLYLSDGAIRRSQLSRDGRHLSPIDDTAWHLLAVSPQGEVLGCARYVSHSDRVSFSELGVSKAAIAGCPEWGSHFQTAVEREIALARANKVAYVEVGGWALANELRYSMEAVRIALSSYSLARALGGCIGIGTVTRRHCSSTILRRIGGRALTTESGSLPHYFDPGYGCEMEILRFDSSAPNHRFEDRIMELYQLLGETPVIRPENPLYNLGGVIERYQPEIPVGWPFRPALVDAI